MGKKVTEMYRFAIIIGVIIVVLLAEPVACVRFEPPECRSVGLGVVTKVPLANNVRGKPKRGKILGQKFCLDIGVFAKNSSKCPELHTLSCSP